MKVIKVAEATDVQLDWLVAKCQGYRPVYTNGRLRPVFLFSDVIEPTWPAYTADWSQMGPIIEQAGIDVFTSYEGSRIEGSFAEQTGWAARRHAKGGPISPKRFLGASPLIAAARCYVASKMGETVEVPEELT